MKILVVNCGSSSIKYQLFQMPAGSGAGQGMLERIGDAGSALNYTRDGQTTRQTTCQVANHEEGLALILRR